jgi:hypothetical protein
LDVTNGQFAANEESLGMSPDGSLLAGSWNDWHFNDGCGFSYSTDGGATWAPESFVPGLTATTNDPSVPGLNQKFTIAGDPAVAYNYNPKFKQFDVVCQAFGTATGNQSSCWRPRLIRGPSWTATTPTAATAWPHGGCPEA